MIEEKEYDVVVDVLKKHINKLWDITQGNEEWGIMDHIRMDHIKELQEAIQVWNEHKEKHGTK